MGSSCPSRPRHLKISKTRLIMVGCMSTLSVQSWSGRPQVGCIVRSRSGIIDSPIIGVIIGAHVNAPGSWHDSRVAQPIYRQLREQTPEGYYLVADTAFPRGTADIQGRI